MQTESLPLTEWYKLAENLAAVANKMVQTGREMETIPAEADETITDYLCHGMARVIDYDFPVAALSRMCDDFSDWTNEAKEAVAKGWTKQSKQPKLADDCVEVCCKG